MPIGYEVMLVDYERNPNTRAYMGYPTTLNTQSPFFKKLCLFTSYPYSLLIPDRILPFPCLAASD